MKKLIRCILKWIGFVLLAALVCTLAFRFLYARNWRGTQEFPASGLPDFTYESAIADGTITPEEVAVHYAPVIDQAVNLLLSAGGRGDFITAVDYDGDWAASNNWEHLLSGNLGAVVYYSVQETDTHWFVGYCFYHPRDDAEIWLDRHENDLEGVMLAVPKSGEGWQQPEYLYMQGHGNVYFCFGDGETGGERMLHGSRYGGAIASLNGRPHLYITPNGTLKSCGHSVESAAGHSAYWSVGDSGVRYYHGGEAQTPCTWNGAFARNLCAYELRPLEELWSRRTGPYDGTDVFGSYGAFDGDNWGEDKANPPWAWRNKTLYGFGGSFLTDPVWTLNQAISGAALSAEYVSNPFADWKLTVTNAILPRTVSAEACTLHLMRDGWEFSNPAWFTLTEKSPGVYGVTMGSDARTVLYAASPAGGTWRMEVRDAQGRVVPGAAVSLIAEYLK